MITIRNTFCTIMLASTVSLFAMDANREARMEADSKANKEMTYLDYVKSNAEMEEKMAYKEAYVHAQVRSAFKRATKPAILTKEQCEEACKDAERSALGGIRTAADLSASEYDGLIARALWDQEFRAKITYPGWFKAKYFHN